MGFLIDTNILSELRKGSKIDKNVREWFDAVPADDIYLSTLAVGEVRHGIELLRRRDPKAAYVWTLGLLKYRKILATGFCLLPMKFPSNGGVSESLIRCQLLTD